MATLTSYTFMHTYQCAFNPLTAGVAYILYRQEKYMNTRSRKLLTSALFFAIRTMHVSLVQRPAKTQNFTKLNNTVCSRFIHPDTVRHHTFSKNAMASSGCQSRTIKSQHHVQESPCYLTESFGMVSQVQDV